MFKEINPPPSEKYEASGESSSNIAHIDRVYGTSRRDGLPRKGKQIDDNGRNFELLLYSPFPVRKGEELLSSFFSFSTHM